MFARGRWFTFAVGLYALGAGPSCGSDRCADGVQHVESCHRKFNTDICADKSGRCAAECFGRATCEELSEQDLDRTPPWLSMCLYKCIEPATCKDDGHTIQKRWLCDGERDCADGSDERDCIYFHCKDGTPIGVDQHCDGYPDCSDESDEDCS